MAPFPWSKGTSPILEKAIKEGNVIKKKVDQIVKESNTLIKKKKVKNKDDKLKQMYQKCLNLKTSVDDHVTKVEGLSESDKEKVEDFNKKKAKEIQRMAELKVSLILTMDKLLPGMTEEEFLGVKTKPGDTPEEESEDSEEKEKSSSDEEEEDEGHSDEDETEEEEEEKEEKKEREISKSAGAQPKKKVIEHEEEEEEEEDEDEDEEEEEEDSDEEEDEEEEEETGETGEEAEEEVKRPVAVKRGICSCCHSKKQNN